MLREVILILPYYDELRMFVLDAITLKLCQGQNLIFNKKGNDASINRKAYCDFTF